MVWVCFFENLIFVGGVRGLCSAPHSLSSLEWRGWGIFLRVLTPVLVGIVLDISQAGRGGSRYVAGDDYNYRAPLIIHPISHDLI